MKKIKSEKAKTKKTIFGIGMWIMFFSAFLGFMSWLQISQYTYGQFDSQCKETNYKSCMRWFWETKGFFQTVEIISIAILILSFIFVIINKKKKTPNI